MENIELTSSSPFHSVLQQVFRAPTGPHNQFSSVASPAFKGMDGFGDGVAYHTKIIGTTAEFIKDVMDEGKIIMQTACAVDPNLGQAALRHRIFVHQCKTLLQVVKWLVEERVWVSGDKVTILGSSFHERVCAALDFP